MKEKRFPFRLCFQILILAGLLALGAAVLLPLWRVANAGMAGVRDGLIGNLELRLGREIRYSSISPSIFGAFDIRNVSVTGDGEEPVLTVSRFRVSYSIFDILFRRTLAIRSIRLDAPVIDFDTVRDGDILDLLDSLGDGRDGGARGMVATLPDGVSLQIRNGRFSVGGAGGRFEMDAFNLTAGIDGTNVGFDGRWNAGFTAESLMGSPIRLRFAMRAEGAGCVDSGEGEGVFSIPSVSGDAASSGPLDFALAFRDGSFSVRKTPGGLPFGLSFEYGFADGSIDAGFYAAGFVPGELFSFYGGLGSFGRILDVAVSGGASLRARNGLLDYGVNLVGNAASRGDGAAPVLEIIASGDENEIRVQSLRLSLPETDDPGARFFGTVAFAGSAALGPFAPEGTILLDGLSVAGMRELDTEIAVSSGDAGISFAAGALRIRDAGTARLGATLRPGGADVGFDASLVWPGSGPSPAAVELRGTAGSRPRRIEAGLVVDSFPVRDLAEIASPRDSGRPAAFLADGTAVSAELFLSSDFATFSYSAPSVVFSGGDLGGTLSFAGNESGLELGESVLVFRGETLRLSGSADFAVPGAVDFRLNAGYRGLGYFVEGTVLNGSVAIRGSNGLDVKLAANPGGGHSGHVRAESFPIPFLGNPALLSSDAELELGASGMWTAALRNFEVSNIAGPAGLARIRVSGGVDESGAVFPELFYEDAIGPLSGSAEFSWPDGERGLEWRVLVGGGAESYLSEGSFADGNLELALFAAGVRLYRFSRNLRNTTADGNLRLAWSSADSFSAELELSSVRGRTGAGEFAASARAGLDADELRLENLRLDFAGLEGSVPSMALSRADGTLRGLVEAGGTFGGRPVSGTMALDAGFDPPDSWGEIGGALYRFSGRADVEGFAYGAGAERQDFAFAFSRDGRAASVSGGPRNMLRFRMDRDDNFFLALSSPFPVRGSVIGTIRDNEINARCNDLFIDLAGLFGIIPENDNFFISDGYVTASVDIRGTLRDPEFYGQARGTGVRIHVPKFIAQELRPTPFNAVFDGDEIRFGPVPTAVGSGAGTVSAWFRFERWIPNIFSIDIAVPRETPIPFDMNLTGFVARGDIAGGFNVSMEYRTFSHTGNLWANNTEMGVNTDEIGAGTVPFGNVRTPFTAAVTVTTGPAIEFLYPTANFPIVRATPEMGTRVYVTADSLAREFSVNGDVRIRSGEIFYFQRSFYIRSGLLVFRENEQRFDPLLTARAEIRDRTADGPVTVSMVVDSAPLTTFTARFESSPPMSQVEIFTLLGQHIAGPHFDGPDGPDPMRAFLTTTTDLFAQFTVVRAIEQQIRNVTRLDMFSIRTQALQNAVFAEMGFVQQPHVDTNGRLGNYLDNTTIFGGRYFGQDMFVQGMVSMRRDAVGGLTIQPDIGFDFQGPKIGNYNLRFRWDLVPTSPENWFVNDNSLTITFSGLF